jgi:chromosome segregation ATPase
VTDNLRMANYVGTSLARLIRARSYAGGERLALEEQLAASATKLREAEAAHSALTQALATLLTRIADLDAQIKARSEIRAEEIRALKATPKRVKCRHGSMISELVRLFREAGRPLSTVEIRDHMATRFRLSLETVEERTVARQWARDKIKSLLRKGAVVRLHDPSESRSGLWLWVGL